MKKFNFVLSIVLMILLVTGCSQISSKQDQGSSSTPKQSASKSVNHSDKSSKTTPSSGSSVRSTPSSSESSTQTNSTASVQTSSSSQASRSSSSSRETGTLTQVRKEVRAALKTNTALPQNLTVASGKYISATTQRLSSGYRVIFKQTNYPVKVNDPSLKNSVTLITLTVSGYSNPSDAANQITFHKYGKTDGQSVDLGAKITGYQDAGAGTAGVSWNEGRWTLMSLSATTDAAKGVALAKNVVSFLQTHSLPVPHQYGMIQVHSDSRQNFVIWQESRTIYQLSSTSDPMKLLAAAVSMK
ncbi:MAG: hypothetical protein ACE3JK_17680 [Sporolactobacillus sp.]